MIVPTNIGFFFFEKGTQLSTFIKRKLVLRKLKYSIAKKFTLKNLQDNRSKVDTVPEELKDNTAIIGESILE